MGDRRSSPRRSRPFPSRLGYQLRSEFDPGHLRSCSLRGTVKDRVGDGPSGLPFHERTTSRPLSLSTGSTGGNVRVPRTRSRAVVGEVESRGRRASERSVGVGCDPHLVPGRAEGLPTPQRTPCPHSWAPRSVLVRAPPPVDTTPTGRRRPTGLSFRPRRSPETDTGRESDHRSTGVRLER